MYAFLFDRKSLVLVLAALALTGVLFFGAGMLVGAHLLGNTVVDNPPRRLPKVFEPAPVADTAGPDLSAWEPERSAEQEQDATAAKPAERPRDTPLPPPPPAAAEETASEETPAAAADPPAPPVEESRSSPGTYTVQAGAFRDLEHAQKRVAQLERGGFGSYVKVSRSTHGTVFYKVRIGRYASREEAQTEAARIHQHLESEVSGEPDAGEEEEAVLVLRTD